MIGRCLISELSDLSKNRYRSINQPNHSLSDPFSMPQTHLWTKKTITKDHLRRPQSPPTWLSTPGWIKPLGCPVTNFQGRLGWSVHFLLIFSTSVFLRVFLLYFSSSPRFPELHHSFEAPRTRRFWRSLRRFGLQLAQNRSKDCSSGDQDVERRQSRCGEGQILERSDSDEVRFTSS